MCAWAKALDLREVADLLHETLREERAADQKLSAIAEKGINDAASTGADEDEEDSEMDKAQAGSEPTTSATGSSSSKMSSRNRRH